ncbi:unnamed protein product [Bursaphelenchus okinawaensis]|uniref:Uncharacterized protein n=1 Tax=Bursaphelenchus okinawaensis TaxID=465554 RepID=A0A811KAX4_9BILA|nr:unnamed protein product [Bursaphelenchus okinawaensis]CAG9096496.1 unnamed protein product [Bursaphelenchus okinawaensis]
MNLLHPYQNVPDNMNQNMNMQVPSTSAFTQNWINDLQAGTIPQTFNYAPSQMTLQSYMTGITECSMAVESDPAAKLNELIPLLQDLDVDVNMRGHDVFRGFYKQMGFALEKEEVSKKQLHDVFFFIVQTANTFLMEYITQIRSQPCNEARVKQLRRAVVENILTLRNIYHCSIVMNRMSDDQKLMYIKTLINASELPEVSEAFLCLLHYARKYISLPIQAQQEACSPVVIRRILELASSATIRFKYKQFVPAILAYTFKYVSHDRERLLSIDEFKSISLFILGQIGFTWNMLSDQKSGIGEKDIIDVFGSWIYCLMLVFPLTVMVPSVVVLQYFNQQGGFLHLSGLLNLALEYARRKKDVILVEKVFSPILNGLHVLHACSGDTDMLGKVDVTVVFDLSWKLFDLINARANSETVNKMIYPLLGMVTNLLVMDTHRVDLLLTKALNNMPACPIFPLAALVHTQAANLKLARNVEMLVLLICELNKGIQTKQYGNFILFQPIPSTRKSGFSLNEILKFVVLRERNLCYEQLDYRNVERVFRCWRRVVKSGFPAGQTSIDYESVCTDTVHHALYFMNERCVGVDFPPALCGALEQCIELVRLFLEKCSDRVKMSLISKIIETDMSVFLKASEPGTNMFLRLINVFMMSLKKEDAAFVAGNWVQEGKISNELLNTLNSRFPSCGPAILDLRDILNFKNMNDGLIYADL